MNPRGKIKVYVCAPWSDRELMPALGKKAEANGFEITHSWWEVEDTPEEERSLEILKAQAYADLTGVKQADIIILINSKKSEGKAVEQGIALADGKPIIAVGKRGEMSANVFHYLSLYEWVESFDEALVLAKKLGDEQVNRRMGSPE